MTEPKKWAGYSALYAVEEAKEAKKVQPEQAKERGTSTTSGTSTSTTTSTTLKQSSSPAPARDFQRVANSITREAVPGGLFAGKSKQLYDYLYSLTRGAISPRMTTRVSNKDLMVGADIASEMTLRSNVARLCQAGLIDMVRRVGAHEGNEYTVYLPEEMETRGTSGTSTSSGTNTTETSQKLVPLVPLETSTTSTTLNPEDSTTSGGPKTSFKTNTEKTDDEAFADLLAVLKQAAKKVTGREPSAAERARWKEVAELLATELEVAASRTAVTSAPAFLAEHLRRRLRKADARQIEREVREASSGGAKPAGAAKPELSPEQIQEQVNLLVSLMRDGAEMKQLEEQFAANFRPAQWHTIRSIALAQAQFTAPVESSTESET